jgi:hypothetical protein
MLIVLGAGQIDKLRFFLYDEEDCDCGDHQHQERYQPASDQSTPSRAFRVVDVLPDDVGGRWRLSNF